MMQDDFWGVVGKEVSLFERVGRAYLIKDRTIHGLDISMPGIQHTNL